jgi:hypothetical protein
MEGVNRIMPVNASSYPAPSAATIAAAVAAPSAATIAAAVAAPSAATITSAVTAAGNSAGWGNSGETTTIVASGTFSGGVSALNLSGLSGYKKYKLVIGGLTFSGQTDLRCYLNTTTTDGNYSMAGVEYANNDYARSIYTVNKGGTIYFSNASHLNIPYFEFTVEAASLSGYKPLTSKYTGIDSSGFHKYVELSGIWNSTATLNRIYLSVNGPTWNAGFYTLYGVN